MDTFDSRGLGAVDCYGQRFMKTGSFSYNILPIGGHCVNMERPFTITVKEGPPRVKMQQHIVKVDFRHGQFTPDQKELVINSGDMVLWNCQDRRAVPYVVSGDKKFFSSDKMASECGFTHAFGSSGKYRWVDAYGSGVGGTIIVKDPECKTQTAFKRWQSQLSKGIIVMINGETAKPRDIEIVTGQTVFFSILKAPGITVTDVRVLEGM